MDKVRTSWPDPDTRPTVSSAEATWISKHVLTRAYLKSCGGVKLVRLCRCQYGKCGHCGAGHHAKCTTRVGFNGNPPPGPDTHIVGRTGAALADVWSTGRGCRWTCSCEDCPENPPTPAEKTEAPRRVRGEIRLDDTVWLTPKTLGCPAICWKQPRARVVAVDGLYLVVNIDGTRHRIHVDNVRRTDPVAISREPRPVKPRKPMPEGFVEQQLF